MERPLGDLAVALLDIGAGGVGHVLLPGHRLVLDPGHLLVHLLGHGLGGLSKVLADADFL